MTVLGAGVPVSVLGAADVPVSVLGAGVPVSVLGATGLPVSVPGAGAGLTAVFWPPLPPVAGAGALGLFEPVTEVLGVGVEVGPVWEDPDASLIRPNIARASTMAARAPSAISAGAVRYQGGRGSGGGCAGEP
ncbi:MAG: hypothetical protein JO152_04025 [Mycobacteriaceae bacterium]|nr:hypothetical protein [Mycobacteriaceae bacterium]